MTIKRILVPLDGSHYAEQALPVALDLARATKGCIELLAVAPRYPDAFLLPAIELEDIARERILDYLLPRVERVKAEGVEASERVAQGSPAEEIVRQAQESGSDLIVMTTHGLGASGSYVIGSVAMKVLETAPCPVLLVRVTR